MLTRTLFSTMKSQYERVIDTLGVPMSWTHIKSGLTLSVIGTVFVAYRVWSREPRSPRTKRRR